MTIFLIRTEIDQQKEIELTVYKSVGFFMLTGMLFTCLPAWGFDNFEDYADADAMRRNYTGFDENNPFPEKSALSSEGANHFASFSSVDNSYAVIVREVSFNSGHRNSLLRLKLRGSVGDAPLTVSIAVRPQKSGENIIDKRFTLPVDEWTVVELDCPELLNLDSCVIIISWLTESGEAGRLDIDDLEWGVSEEAAVLDKIKNNMVDDFTGYSDTAELQKVYNSGWGDIAPSGVSLGEYDGHKVLELSSYPGKMESLAWREVNNSAVGTAGGISLSLADINVHPRSGAVYVSVRKDMESEDLAVLKIDNYDRQLDSYTLYCPELLNLEKFIVVLSTFSCDREEYNVSKKLFDIYGGKAVSTTLGNPVKVAITDLRLLTLAETVNIIPRPGKVDFSGGEFILSRKAAIVAESEAERRQAEYLRAVLSPAIGYTLPVIGPERAGEFATPIRVEILPELPGVGEEGYRLTVTPEEVVISGISERGVFYGVQSLRQLFPPEVERGIYTSRQWRLPTLTIVDNPAFEWRGMHLDTARHFFPKEFLFRFIDMLAEMKMNRFQWHYNDGVSWSIEIDAFPKLIEVGAWRGGEAGGYYTAADVREIVDYAKARFITIIPEIEMPTHANAALAAYPEFSCQRDLPFTGEINTPQHFIRPHYGRTYCAAQDETYEFIERLIEENIKLFPDADYIHLGGDELPADLWNACPKCSAFMKEHGWDAHDLQAYFTRRVEEIVEKHGRRMMGWEQIMTVDLSPDTLIQAYLGPEGLLKALAGGHKIINNNASTNYLDYYQDIPENEPVAITSGITGLRKSYSFNPLADVPAEYRDQVIGGQSALWTEYIQDERQAGYQLYPRGIAIAECLWTPEELKSWPDFERRMNEFYRRLKYKGLNFRDYR